VQAFVVVVVVAVVLAVTFDPRPSQAPPCRLCKLFPARTLWREIIICLPLIKIKITNNGYLRSLILSALSVANLVLSKINELKSLNKNK